MHLHGSSHEAHCLRCCPQTFILHPRRAMITRCRILHHARAPFPHFFPNQSSNKSAKINATQRGALTEIPLLTGYEPNWIVEDRDYRHSTGDGQFTELEDLRIRPLSYHQSIKASTYDSAASIATLPESDFDDEQLRAMLASPLYRQELGASAGRSQVYHSERENLMSSSSQDPTSTGKLVAVFFQSRTG